SPHETTLSRAAAQFSVAELRDALTGWLTRLVADQPRAAAVDGKTSKQALDADGDPVHVLNVFAHTVKVCLADWPVGDGKATEPEKNAGRWSPGGSGAMPRRPRMPARP